MARERVEQGATVLAERAGLEHLLDGGLAILQHAKIERNRSWVDAGYTGHMIGP